jgi:acetyltransferase-like isoleucine patch superfamily enzyme
VPASRLQDLLATLQFEVFHGWGLRQASRVRGRWQKIRNPHATIHYGGWNYFGPGFRIQAPLGGTFICGDHNQFREGFTAELDRPESRIEIGSHCHFTYYSVLQCGTNISIGDRVMFGQSSIVADDRHRFRDVTKPMLEQGYEIRSITIEDDVTTTSKCTILADIGTRTVVGANSVVSRPLPPHSLAVGTPAEVVEDLG